MTETDLKERIGKLEREDIQADEKQRRMATLNAAYANQQTVKADAAKQSQEAAEANLRDMLKTAYLKTPAASEDDFSKDYPALRSEYLRSTALKENESALAAQARTTHENF